LTQSQPTYREDWNARRALASSAAFFEPYLQPGLRLLDVGCGPGSLTVDFAETLAPGEVVGLDSDPRVLDRARTVAQERGDPVNLSFQLGDVYDLPYPSDSFDAVWTSSLMQWLDQPTKALREIYRVLKPGGLYATRDRDRTGDLFGNANRLLLRALNLHYWQNERQTGGRFRRGSGMRALMLKAGFQQIVTGASYENHSGPEGARFIVGLYDRALRADIRPRAVNFIKAQGWADDAQLAQMLQAWETWAQDPRSFYSICRVEHVGLKPT
jgi:ubiquinone/menaquinone biosynthesis C-methylase UbiE